MKTANNRSKYQFRCSVRWLPRRLHLWWHYPKMMREPDSPGKRNWIEYAGFTCCMTKPMWARAVERAQELVKELNLEGSE